MSRVAIFIATPLPRPQTKIEGEDFSSRLLICTCTIAKERTWKIVRVEDRGVGLFGGEISAYRATTAKRRF